MRRKTAAPRPRNFIYCIDTFARADGKVWCVRTGGKWINCTKVICMVPTYTEFRGAMARQPKALVRGFQPAYITEKADGSVVITGYPDLQTAESVW